MEKIGRVTAAPIYRVLYAELRPHRVRNMQEHTHSTHKLVRTQELGAMRRIHIVLAKDLGSGAHHGRAAILRGCAADKATYAKRAARRGGEYRNELAFRYATYQLLEEVVV